MLLLSACASDEKDTVERDLSDSGDAETTETGDDTGCVAEEEVCDDLDNDCNDLVDDVADPTIWYRDADEDGYGDAATIETGCSAPSGHVADDSDCDDTDATVHPGATEVEGDDLDADCDGSDVCGEGPCEELGSETNPAESCADLYARTGAATEAWWIDAGGEFEPFLVWCDMKDDGGGWTLVLKTDATSADHYSASAVRADALATPDLDAVAKLGDAAILALQATRSATGEVRVSPSGPSDVLIVAGLTWAMADTGSVSRSITARNGDETSFSTGYVCYDGDMSTSPGCDPDHWCFGKEDAEHSCIRRYATAGIWMNYGIFTAAYYEATVWVR